MSFLEHGPKPLPTIKDLFARTWDAYKRRLRSILVVYVLSAAAAIAVVMVAGLLALPAIAFAPLLVLPAVFLPVALFILGFGAQSMALETAMHDGVAWRYAFDKAKKDWGSFAWMNIASSLVSMGAFFLFIVPGIILLPALRVMEYVFKAEGKTGLSALMHAYALVNGRWWKTAGRMLFFAILVGIVPTVVEGLMPDPASVQEAITSTEVVLTLVSIAYAFFFAAPISLVFGAEIYHDLKSTAASGTEQATEASRGKWTAVAVVGWVLGTATVVGMVVLLGPLFLETLDSMQGL